MPEGSLKYFLPALIWAALIFAVSSIPNLSTPSMGFSMSDKVAHFVEYFILGFLTASAFRNLVSHSWRLFLVSATVSGAYGILDEAHQLFVPGRSTEGFDMVADILGSILAAAIFVWRMKKKSPDPR